MSSEANPVADCLLESESACPTVNELIFQLRASFSPLEFEHAVKMLRDREEYMEQKYLDLKKKAKDELKKKQTEVDDVMKLNADIMTQFRVYEKQALQVLELRKKGEEEKDSLVSENLKLNNELKTKQTEIDDVMKLNADVMTQFRVYEKQVVEVLELRKKGEEEKDLLVSENLKLSNELKTKQTVIDAVKKVNAEKGRKIRDYEKRYLDDLEVKKKAEEEKQLLISKLNDASKTKRNDKVNAEYEAFKLKAEEEKKLLALENMKLTEELKMKRNDIDAAMKVSAEYEGKVRDYEKWSLDDREFKANAEKEKERLVHANLKLNEELQSKQRDFDAMMKRNSEYESKIRAFENKSLESDAAESSRKVSKNEGSKRKLEHKLHEIIEIDDDDDLESLSKTKKRQVCNEKTDIKYSSRFFPNSEGQEKRPK